MAAFSQTKIRLFWLWPLFFILISFQPSYAQKSNYFTVIPLKNLTGNPKNDWVSEGYAELLSDFLKEVENVRVASRLEIEENRRKAVPGKKTSDLDFEEIEGLFYSQDLPPTIIYGSYSLQKKDFHFKVSLYDPEKQETTQKIFEFKTSFLLMLSAFDQHFDKLLSVLDYKPGKPRKPLSKTHNLSSFVHYNKSWVPHLEKDFTIATSHCEQALMADSHYLPALYRLMDIYEQQESWEQAFNIYQQLEELLTKSRQYRKLFSIYNKMSRYYKRLDQFPYEVRYLSKILKLIKKHSLKVSPSKQYIAIGDAYHRRGMFDQALKFYFISIKRLVQAGNRHLIAQVMAKTGDVFISKNIDTRALKYYMNALKNLKDPGAQESLFQTEEDKQVIEDYDLEAKLYTEIGAIYYGKRRYPKAIKYYDKALAIKDKLKSKALLSRIYNEIGKVNLVSFESGQALKNFQTALELAKKDELSKPDRIETLTNIATIYIEKRNYRKALQYYQKVLALQKDSKDLVAISDLHLKIGECYQHLKNNQAALKNYLESLEIKEGFGTTETDVTGLIEVHTYLGDIYLSKNRYKKAMKHYLRLVDINRHIEDNANLASAYIRLAKTHELLGEWYLGKGKIQKADASLHKAILYAEQSVRIGRTGRMGKKYFGDYDLILKLIKGAVHKKRFHNPDLLSKLQKGHAAKSEFGSERLLKLLLESRIVSDDSDSHRYVRFDPYIKSEEQLTDRIVKAEIMGVEPVIEVWKKSRTGRIFNRDFNNDSLVEELLKKGIITNDSQGYAHFDPDIQEEEDLRRQLKEVDFLSIKSVREVWKKSLKDKLIYTDRKNKNYVRFVTEIKQENQLKDRLQKQEVRDMGPVIAIWKESQKERVLENDESDHNYVFFNGSITYEEKLKKRLHKLGVKNFNKLNAVVNLWREAVQNNNPNYSKDLYYLRVLKGEVTKEAVEKEEEIDVGDISIGSDEEFLMEEEETEEVP